MRFIRKGGRIIPIRDKKAPTPVLKSIVSAGAKVRDLGGSASLLGWAAQTFSKDTATQMKAAKFTRAGLGVFVGGMGVNLTAKALRHLTKRRSQ